MEPTIYLFFNGNCLEAMKHYAETLNGEVGGIFLNKDAPDANNRMDGGDDLVMNMAIKLGSATVMASDMPEGRETAQQGFSISIAPDSLAEFDRIFEALSKDAKAIHMPPEETFWAERFTTFTDRFGTPWMLNFVGSKG
ncbi:VOC family protein [Falsihalocynthiibacter sp. SS001]|uniref:VOC family protein n=1 Tax=Falsihalocynthiibacter sp. SS001 TaxID=3349698 RepID=UPI0036D32E22